MNIYINSAEAISAQETFDNYSFESKNPENGYFLSLNPNYKEYIKPKMLRRMSNIIRMGVATSLKSLSNANNNKPDAIIMGTGLGCLKDTIKFLNQLIDNKESMLNPTAFIQSTHNTIAGQIALILGCKNYNFTFTQQDISFETALIDSILLLNNKNNKDILLGAGDEITEETYELLNKANCAKNLYGDDINSDSQGYIPGEGFASFMLSNYKSEKNVAKIEDVQILKSINMDNADRELNDLLEESNTKIEDIDVLISGYNGNSDNIQKYELINDTFNKSELVQYKHLTGEFDTASAFALWLSTAFIEKQVIPDELIIKKQDRKNINKVLIHSYSKAHKHSFILVSKC